MDIDLINEIDAAVTICDKEGIIIYMNKKSVKTFESDGGTSLLGKNLFDCHPESAKVKLKDIMVNKKTNCYTIEKNGIKKMIFQSLRFDNGRFKGIVEISIALPDKMEHFIRT